MLEDSDLKRVLDKFFKKDQNGEYMYTFYKGESMQYKRSRAIVKMLGIYSDEMTNDRRKFNYLRIEQVVNTILDILETIKEEEIFDEPPQGTQVNNFLLLFPHDNRDDDILINNPDNINMFGTVRYIVYNGNTYAVPEMLLRGSTRINLYASLMSMLIFLLRYAQSEGAKGQSAMKIPRSNVYRPVTDSNSVKIAISPPGLQTKSASNIAPPIQPETGQSEDVRPDPNLQQYAEAVNPDFIKTHDTVEQPVVTLGFEPELDEVDRELLELVNQPVVQEQRNVVNLEQLVNQVINQYADPLMVRLISSSINRIFTFNNPIDVPLGIVAGSGLGDVEPIALIGGPEDIQNNERIVADVMSKNPLFFRSELLKETFLSFARLIASLYRGPDNLTDAVIQSDLLDIDQDTIRIAIEGVKHQLELYAINNPNIVSLSLLTGGAVTSSILLNSLLYILASLLNTLGLTTGPSVFVDVDNVIIIKDMNGNTLRVIDNGEVNFSPDPISSQTGYQVVLEPNSYQIEKNIPSREEVQQAKTTFDTELYNFIGNRMLSVSKLNMEPTFIQPGYSLLYNISTEIDTLYTALVQGDKTAIDQFLPKYNKFLVENKQVILNHVNQPYYPSPDPDDEDDDDISSDGSGSPFPKKPNKFADSKEGEWYIMKTLIYWLMRHVAKIYDYTSVHMQNLFLISQEIASSIYTTIIGRHPYLFTTGIALTLLEPQFIPQIIDLFVLAFGAIITVTKSVFSLLSSSLGLLLVVGGLGFLAYTFAKNGNLSLF